MTDFSVKVSRATRGKGQRIPFTIHADGHAIGRGVYCHDDGRCDYRVDRPGPSKGWVIGEVQKQARIRKMLPPPKEDDRPEWLKRFEAAADEKERRLEAAAEDARKTKPPPSK